MECPRCGSRSIKPVSGSPVENPCEFECYGGCFKDHPNQPEDFGYIYFQYDTDDDTYCWPAIGVLYKCSGDELVGVRRGRIKLELI